MGTPGIAEFYRILNPGQQSLFEPDYCSKYFKHYHGKKNASKLEAMIIDFINLSPHASQAENVKVMGVMRNGKWTKSNMTKGTSDIHAIKNGIAVKIEVKYAKSDQWSLDQMIYATSVVSAGGFYILIEAKEDEVKGFELFYKAWQKIGLNNGKTEGALMICGNSKSLREKSKNISTSNIEKCKILELEL